MVGIVITSHGNIAQELVETSKLFFGEQKQMKACCLKAEDNPDEFVDVLKDAIKEVDSGDGVVVFCDLLYGTPCNCMIRIIGEDLDNDNIQVLTGVNLAMLLQVLSDRENLLIDKLIKSGQEGITDLKEILKTNL